MLTFSVPNPFWACLLGRLCPRKFILEPGEHVVARKGCVQLWRAETGDALPPKDVFASLQAELYKKLNYNPDKPPELSGAEQEEWDKRKRSHFIHVRVPSDTLWVGSAA